MAGKRGHQDTKTQRFHKAKTESSPKYQDVVKKVRNFESDLKREEILKGVEEVGKGETVDYEKLIAKHRK